MNYFHRSFAKVLFTKVSKGTDFIVPEVMTSNNCIHLFSLRESFTISIDRESFTISIDHISQVCFYLTLMPVLTSSFITRAEIWEAMPYYNK